MPLYSDDIYDIREDINNLKKDYHSVLSAFPGQFSVYGNTLKSIGQYGALGAMVRTPYTLYESQTFGAIVKANLYGFAFTSGFNQAILPTANELFGGKFVGMWGTRTFQRPVWNFIMGATRKIPIVNTFVEETAKVAIGGPMNLGNMWLFGINKELQKHVLGALGPHAEEIANARNIFEKTNIINKLNIDDLAKAYAKSAGIEAKTVASGLSKFKTLAKFGAAAQSLSYIYAAYDVPTTIGNLISGAIRLGSNYTEFINKNATRFIDRIRRTDLGGDISAYITQAAVTERTRALQIMQASRVNGAYQFGNETQFI